MDRIVCRQPLGPYGSSRSYTKVVVPEYIGIGSWSFVHVCYCNKYVMPVCTTSISQRLTRYYENTILLMIYEERVQLI